MLLLELTIRDLQKKTRESKVAYWRERNCQIAMGDRRSLTRTIVDMKKEGRLELNRIRGKNKDKVQHLT